jgi:hypothetical protein
MNIHVVTPFSRPPYFPKLRAVLCSQAVTWHLICHEPQKLPAIPEPWIKAYDCGNNEPYDWCYWKLNWFLENVPIDAAARYGVICDDDSCQPDYFDRIRAAGEASVVITSRDFGKNHGGFRADPRNMRVGCVGFQFWALGSCFEKLRFHPRSHAGDGIMACALAEHFETVYLPEAAGWYNGLSNGRQFPGDEHVTAPGDSQIFRKP